MDLRACAPGSFKFTVDATSSSGAPLLTNPEQAGAYSFQLAYGPQPSRAQLSIRPPLRRDRGRRLPDNWG